MKRVDEFDYCVVNAEGQQEAAVASILSIIESEHHRVVQKVISL